MSSSATANVSSTDQVEGEVSTSASVGMSEDNNVESEDNNVEFEDNNVESEEELMIRGDDGSEKSNLGMILGISVGTIVVGLLVYYFLIRKKTKVIKVNL